MGMVVKKRGVLGGTFDPVHLGHIGVAEAARDALGLTKVVLVPAGQPMSKVNQRVTAPEHRLRMLRLAIRGRPRLGVSRQEIERSGPSFTVDTIAELKRE